MWDHMLCSPVCPTCFTEQYASEIYSCFACNNYSFHCIELYYMTVLQLEFIHSTSGEFVFGYYK